MPAPAIKSLAEKHGIAIDAAENLWSKAKTLASEQGKKESAGEEFYRYVMGIFKRMIGETASSPYLSTLEVAFGLETASTMRIVQFQRLAEDEPDKGHRIFGQLLLSAIRDSGLLKDPERRTSGFDDHHSGKGFVYDAEVDGVFEGDKAAIKKSLTKAIKDYLKPLDTAIEFEFGKLMKGRQLITVRVFTQVGAG